MSELNSGKIKITNDGNIIMQFSNYHHVIDSDTELYYKHQADKVIAEKDAKILTLDAEVFKQKHHARLFFDERNYAESQVRRQMYKRCLAMAKWCKYFAYYWECCEPPDCVAFIARAKFHRKWLNRWLELAEKFKEAK